MPEARHAPYPADTRAKGWRFELDYERIEQSATWGLTTLKPEARPWLLMTWYTAWKQTPCGSMPADPEVFAGLIGASDATFAKHRKVLLRGWWLADDGLLYHDTLVQRVLEMLKQRRGDANRQAANRAKKAAELQADSTKQAPVSRVTPPEVQGESSTGTGTSTGRTSTEDSPDAGGGAGADGEFGSGAFIGSAQPTAAGAICGALRRAGIADTNPGHPRLLALLTAGAQPAEFTGFIAAAMDKAPRSPFVYLLGMVEGERERAAANVTRLHRGPMPNKQEALERRNRAVGESWAAKMMAEGACDAAE